MQWHSNLFTIILYLSFEKHAIPTTASGPIKLDEYNFDKVTNKFKASFIKFDILYPFGDKHEAFVKFAEDSISEKDLLVAQVLVNYADNTNVIFARKYGATMNNLPVVMLFIKGKQPILFDKDVEAFTSSKLRRFVSENSGLYLSLPGCVKEFDILAIQFMKSKKIERKNVLKKTEELLKIMKDTTPGKIYKTIMEKVLEKGEKSVKSEFERVKKLLRGKVSDGKKTELRIRINILQTFQSVNEQTQVRQDL